MVSAARDAEMSPAAVQRSVCTVTSSASTPFIGREFSRGPAGSHSPVPNAFRGGRSGGGGEGYSATPPSLLPPADGGKLFP